jgi:hypothetical protein
MGMSGANSATAGLVVGGGGEYRVSDLSETIENSTNSKRIVENEKREIMAKLKADMVHFRAVRKTADLVFSWENVNVSSEKKKSPLWRVFNRSEPKQILDKIKQGVVTSVGVNAGGQSSFLASSESKIQTVSYKTVANIEKESIESLSSNSSIPVREHRCQVLNNGNHTELLRIVFF